MIAQILRGLLLLTCLLVAGSSWALSKWLALPWPLSVILALCGIAACHATVLASQFMIARFIGRHARATVVRTPVGNGSRLRAWMSEVCVSLRTFCFAMPLFGSRPLASDDQGDATPVLLIHGYFCNRAVWRPLARWLAKRGHAIESINLEPAFGSIDDYAAPIERAVKRLQARSGRRSVALIGHSMGGLAIRSYLRQFDHGHISSIITLGTPHRGTWLARFGHASNVRQMRPNSQWLADLFQNESQRAPMRLTVIGTEHDNIVMPFSEQSVANGHWICFRGTGHLGLAYHLSVWEVIEKALRPSAWQHSVNTPAQESINNERLVGDGLTESP